MYVPCRLAGPEVFSKIICNITIHVICFPLNSLSRKLKIHYQDYWNTVSFIWIDVRGLHSFSCLSVASLPTWAVFYQGKKLRRRLLRLGLKSPIYPTSRLLSPVLKTLTRIIEPRGQNFSKLIKIESIVDGQHSPADSSAGWFGLALLIDVFSHFVDRRNRCGVVHRGFDHWPA